MSPARSCPPEATIGCEVIGVWDGLVYWHCEACGRAWHRFPAGDYRRERLERAPTLIEIHESHYDDTPDHTPGDPVR